MKFCWKKLSDGQMVRRDGHGFPVRSAEIEAQDIACWSAFKLQKPETCELQRKRGRSIGTIELTNSALPRLGC
jgi:hypothetical protein